MFSKINMGVITVFLAVLSFLSVGMGTVWTASSCVTLVSNNIAQNQIKISDHEARLRNIESSMSCVKTDVSWIRNYIEENKRIPK